MSRPRCPACSLGHLHDCPVWAVVKAAAAMELMVNDTGWSRGLGYDCTVTMSGRNGLDLHTALTTLLDAARALGCSHTWVDVTNTSVASGAMCSKCGALNPTLPRQETTTTNEETT